MSHLQFVLLHCNVSTQTLLGMETTQATKDVLAIFERIDREGEKLVREAKEFWAQYSNDLRPALPHSEK